MVENVREFETASTPEEFFAIFHDSIRIITQNALQASIDSESCAQFIIIHEQLRSLNKYFSNSKILLFPEDIKKTNVDFDELQAVVCKAEQLQCVNVKLRFPNRGCIAARLNPALPICETFSQFFPLKPPPLELTDTTHGLLMIGQTLDPPGRHSLVLHPDRVRVVCNGISFCLSDTRQLHSVVEQISPNSEVLLVMKMTEAPIESEASYSSFIAHTLPTHDE